MRTIETKAYTFSELSEDAKQKAIESLYDINVDYEWWEFIYEDAGRIGLEIDGFGLDRGLHASGGLTLSAVEVAQNIIESHGEKCETYKLAQEFLHEHAPIFSEYMNEESENYESKELEDDMTYLEDEFTKDLLNEYASMLQREFEHLTSEEVIAQTIEANGYEFTEDGQRI